MKRPLIATLSAALALGTVAAPAMAGETHLKVVYSDLNLNTVAGQETLERRIDAAAKKACGYDEIRTGTRMQNREVTRCYRQAKKQATTQMASVVSDARLGG